ncbi:hypothetical protein MHBO_003220, partial [Bonamia ostreae]
DFSIEDLKIKSFEEEIESFIGANANFISGWNHWLTKESKETAYAKAHSINIPDIKKFKDAIEKIKRQNYKTCNKNLKESKNNSITNQILESFLKKTVFTKGYKQIASNSLLFRIEITNFGENAPFLEILMLGDNTLSSLRNSIDCPNYSQSINGFNIKNKLLDKNKHILKDIETKNNGYFFIEGDFYEHGNGSYSAEIRNWAKNNENVSTNFTFNALPKRMDKRIKEVDLRIDSIYYYCHKGYCKHFVVVKEMRMVSKDDIQNYYCYPLTLLKCQICENGYA